jgi:hypothetical protein
MTQGWRLLPEPLQQQQVSTVSTQTSRRFHEIRFWQAKPGCKVDFLNFQKASAVEAWTLIASLALDRFTLRPGAAAVLGGVSFVSAPASGNLRAVPSVLFDCLMGQGNPRIKWQLQPRRRPQMHLLHQE